MQHCKGAAVAPALSRPAAHLAELLHRLEVQVVKKVIEVAAGAIVVAVLRERDATVAVATRRVGSWA